MCFSAPASFIASGVLAVAGGASVSIAKKEEKFLALIPIFFAIQQAFEGVQWLSLHHGSSCPVAGYGFLTVSSIIWPFYVPFFVYMMDKKKRHIIRWFLYLGLALSCFFIFLYISTPLSISVVGHSIEYFFAFSLKPYINFLYFIVVLFPLFISSIPFLRWFGLVVIVLATLTALFFLKTFISVWCFFAAILSLVIYIYLRKQYRKVTVVGPIKTSSVI